jgi:hypothetical protein
MHHGFALPFAIIRGQGIMDNLEQLASDAEYVVGILANPDKTDVQFVDCTRHVPVDTAKVYAERGLVFVGVVGLVAGQPRVVLTGDDLEPEAITAIAQAFVAHVRKSVRWTWTMKPDLNWN